MKGKTLKQLEDTLPEMREFVSGRRPDAILLAEANVPPDKIPFYFGHGDKMHMLFNFLLNQYMFLALARQEATPICEGLSMLPDIPHVGEWLNFVRNHDELTLDRLNESQLQEVFQAFAPDENMRIYGRGIRRRLAPMLSSDRRHMELVYSLIFSLPGTPMIRYGDEIGMGDDLSLEERNSVRTVMQWSNTKNGGFSTAPPEKLPRPVISGGKYGYEKINVADQQRDANSFVNWMERLIGIRKQSPEFGWGKCEILETDSNHVFALACEGRGQRAIAIHNLSDQHCSVILKHEEDLKQWLEVFSDSAYAPLDSNCISLEPYGYRWFRSKVVPL